MKIKYFLGEEYLLNIIAIQGFLKKIKYGQISPNILLYLL